MTEMTQSHGKDVPGWVFVAVICLCLLGGGAFVYWWLGGSPSGAKITLKQPGDPSAVERPVDGGRRGGFNQPPQRRGPIRLQSATPQQRTYFVQGGRVMMYVTDDKDQPDTFDLRMRRLLDASQQASALMAIRISSDDLMARNLKITDEQRTKLRELGFQDFSERGTRAVLQPEDVAALTAAWNEADLWNKPVAQPAEEKIVATMRQVALKAEGPTREMLLNRVGAISEILRAEQIEAFRQVGAPRPAQPATPAPAPAPAQ